MFRINDYNGHILCEDGEVIRPPYDSPRYQDYAAWIQAGNTPEVFHEEPTEPVPMTVTRFQARAALDQVGLFDSVEAMMTAPETPRVHRLAWTDAQEFRRDSALVVSMAHVLGLSEQQIDDLFRLAKTITA